MLSVEEHTHWFFKEFYEESEAEDHYEEQPAEESPFCQGLIFFAYDKECYECKEVEHCFVQLHGVSWYWCATVEGCSEDDSPRHICFRSYDLLVEEISHPDKRSY